jgi:hypothetical protein
MEMLVATRADIVRCKFQNMRCGEDALVTLEDCEMTQCVIENLELTNGAYFCEGIDTARIKHCKFRNCRTDRQDRKILRGVQLKSRFLSVREREYEIVEKMTCEGLDQIKYIG